MSPLRWILIACGVLLLIAIYVWGRRSDRKSTGSVDAAARPKATPPVISGPVSHAYESLDEAESESPDELQHDVPIVSDDGPVVAAPSRVAAAPRSDDVQRTLIRESRHVRVEPTFNDSGFAPPQSADAADDDDVSLTAELPVREPVVAPTLSMSDTPQPRRIERRKIVSLRLAAAQRYPGEQLRYALEAESLQHGKYDVFHRLDEQGASVFSVASMVEPGTFELDRMTAHSYPGVTLFAQLPGPVPGVHALHELVACGKRLQESLGGTLQDDRGVPLTVHRIDRLRQEIVDFERAQPRDSGHRSQPPAS
ncbi:MAG TPA: cell division protein ZipA C-terminal FtsZ-binding domain-containing protein [Povalibacter sp.]|nr:cell division protein ZipA C-terminal FtsZ-binding domain-containing protein [Povalibacter sp.]